MPEGQRETMHPTDMIEEYEARQQLGLAVQMLSDEQIRLIVRQVLHDWQSVEDESCKKWFQECVKNYVSNPPGFKSPDMALKKRSNVLENPLCNLLRRSGNPSHPLCGSVVQMWTQLSLDLRESVEEFLDGKPHRRSHLDQVRRQAGQGVSDSPRWRKLRSEFDRAHPDKWPAEQIDVMFCCLTRNEDSLPLRRWYSQLSELSHDDPVWEESFPGFCQDLLKLGESKKKVRDVYESVRKRVEKMEKKHVELLRYLELSSLELSSQEILSDVDKARKMLGRLEKFLERLADAKREHAEAGTLTRQQSIHEKIGQLATQITETHNEIIDSFGPVNEPSPLFDMEDEDEELDFEEIREMEKRNEELERGNRELGSRIEEVKTELVAVQEELKGSRDKIKELRNELETSKQNQKTWYNVYLASLMQSGQGGGTVAIESVEDAFNQARKIYSRELHFELNRHSRMTRFENPMEVFSVLQWLAQIYRGVKMGEKKIDLDLSLRHVCQGWNYTPHQNEMTMNTYVSHYQTKVGKTTYTLENHVGTGKSKDERYTFRLAFAWAPDMNKVVIGYAGLHQRTN